MSDIDVEEYRDKVLGCWTGKNIGGTLGDPFEGKREVNNLEFYSQDLNGAPAPNDDLDLQLAWLHAIKENGLENVTAPLLGEYWLGHVNGPWAEYGVCKANMRAGLRPPLSGSCNNERWKFSNGAWIRSEIWACCFPGDPDRAIRYAYMDACVDHCGEGIYAEMFMAALESAAFVVDDVNELVAIALSKVPEDCRVARSARIVVEGRASGKDWLAVREALVADSSDLGWFQAPANVAFVVLGLLYGEGDFGKTVCLAVNCGDDTDCTGATAGAVMGIIGGRRAIPKRWIEPIGESIQLKCLNCFMKAPKTLGELTEQTIDAATSHQRRTGAGGVEISDRPTAIDDAHRTNLKNSDAAAVLWASPSFEMPFDLPDLALRVDYIDGPDVETGAEKRIKVTIKGKFGVYERRIMLRWRLPEGWRVKPGAECAFYLGGNGRGATREFAVTPGELNDAFVYIELEVRDVKRSCPSLLVIPFQTKGALCSSFDD